MPPPAGPIAASVDSTPVTSTVPRVVAAEGELTFSSTATSSSGHAGTAVAPSTSSTSGRTTRWPTASASGTVPSTRRRFPSASETTAAAVTMSGVLGHEGSMGSAGSWMSRCVSTVSASAVGRPGIGTPPSARRADVSSPSPPRTASPAEPPGSATIAAAVAGSSARSVPPRTDFPASSVRTSTGIASVTPGTAR